MPRARDARDRDARDRDARVSKGGPSEENRQGQRRADPERPRASKQASKQASTPHRRCQKRDAQAERERMKFEARIREVVHGSVCFLEKNLMDDLADVLSSKSPTERVVTLGCFLEIMQDPVLKEAEIEELGRIWSLDRDGDEDELMVEDARAALLLARGAEAMMKRARRRVFSRVHPDRFASAGAEKAGALFKALTSVGEHGVPHGLLRALCVVSLQSQMDLGAVEELRAHLRRKHDVVCSMRQSRRARGSTADRSSEEVFSQAEVERAAAEEEGRRRRKKKRETIEALKQRVHPKSPEHRRLQMALVEVLQEEHMTNYEDMEYDPEPLPETDSRLLGSAGGLPAELLELVPSLARSSRMLLTDGLPAPALPRVTVPGPGRMTVLLDDDDSDFEDFEPTPSSSSSSSTSTTTTPSVPSSTSTSTKAKLKAKPRGRRTKVVVATPTDLVGAESKMKLGMYDMLVLAFYWFGLPVEAGSVRHSMGRDVVWLRHVVFVILELQVASRTQAAAIGNKEIAANEFLDYKNQRNRVTSPWNGFKRFLADLDSPEHAHHERDALERGELSCGKLTMKNMKRRPPCPRGPQSKRRRTLSKSTPSARTKTTTTAEEAKLPEVEVKLESLSPQRVGKVKPRRARLMSAKEVRMRSTKRSLDATEEPAGKRRCFLVDLTLED